MRYQLTAMKTCECAGGLPPHCTKMSHACQGCGSCKSNYKVKMATMGAVRANAFAKLGMRKLADPNLPWAICEAENPEKVIAKSKAVAIKEAIENAITNVTPAVRTRDGVTGG